jgi:hypothetical protein
MIQKRFQHYTKNGIEWTQWFDYKTGDESEVKQLKKDCRWQLKSQQLLNDFRYVK